MATILTESSNVSEQTAITTHTGADTIPIHIKVLYWDKGSDESKDFFKRMSVTPQKTMQDNVSINQIIFAFHGYV